MYQTKNGEPVIKHKNFFDELWEKDHPEEAKQVKEQEAEAKKLAQQEKKRKEEERKKEKKRKQ